MPKIDALESGSSSQRHNLNHQAIEDYLKTIFNLAQDESPVSTSRIAEAREVKPASATNMIQRLAKLNLVVYEKHRGVTLTDSGKKLALEVIRHHRLLELYLMEALGFSWDEVHEQADILEHVISEKLEERIAQVLNHPEFDPHGDPIPSKDGVLPVRQTRLLSEILPNETVRIARVPHSSDGELLRYLESLGIVPGTAVTVSEQAPFDGPITLEIEGQQKAIAYNVASSILVEEA
ncbi:MAG: metal-dependent transcriptional regulator [Chloroflexota bacterium]